MIKKFILKKAVKKVATVMAKKEAKIVVGSVITAATHTLIQKAARNYPALSFLKLRQRKV